MGDLTTVLVTGGGAPGIAGTIAALRSNPDNAPVRIITTDIRDRVVGAYLADGFHCLPAPEDPGYIDAILKVASKEGCDVILPQTTREIQVLAEARDACAHAGHPVVVSSPEAIATANDKHSLVQTAHRAGIPCPESVITNSEESLVRALERFGYPERPAVVKPPVSNGMRGLRIVTKNPWNVDRFLSSKPDGTEISLDALIDILQRGEWPELVVSEYLPGEEYTVDVFRGEKGVVAIPRVRLAIRSGITFESRVTMREDLVSWSTTLAEELDLQYCFGFQFKCDGDGVPRLLECNPRVQGTMVVSMFAGFNIVYYAVREALGQPAAVADVEVADGVTFTRYWGGAASDESGVKGIV